jgi:hypothetical protein
MAASVAAWSTPSAAATGATARVCDRIAAVAAAQRLFLLWQVRVIP